VCREGPGRQALPILNIEFRMSKFIILHSILPGSKRHSEFWNIKATPSVLNHQFPPAAGGLAFELRMSIDFPDRDLWTNDAIANKKAAPRAAPFCANVYQFRLLFLQENVIGENLPIGRMKALFKNGNYFHGFLQLKCCRPPGRSRKTGQVELWSRNGIRVNFPALSCTDGTGELRSRMLSSRPQPLVKIPKFFDSANAPRSRMRCGGRAVPPDGFLRLPASNWDKSL
jgi:hypothetical protein